MLGESVLKLGGQPPRFENGAVATGILKNYNTTQWLYTDSRHILLNSHNNFFGVINYLNFYFYLTFFNYNFLEDI